jgi:hypothetical protein
MGRSDWITVPSAKVSVPYSAHLIARRIGSGSIMGSFQTTTLWTPPSGVSMSMRSLNSSSIVNAMAASSSSTRVRST